MHARKLLQRLLLVLALASLVLSFGAPVFSQDPPGQEPGDKQKIEKWYKDKIKKEKLKKEKRITPADRRAAADRAAADGLTAEVMAAMNPALPGDTPRYFSHPNYANSALPVGSVPTVTEVGHPLIPRWKPTDGNATVFVVDAQVLMPTGDLVAFKSYNQPSSGPNTYYAYVLRPTGTLGQYTVVFDSGPVSVPAVTVGEVLEVPVGPFPVQPGDLIAHYGRGIPRLWRPHSVRQSRSTVAILVFR